jgi:SNF2 family DNA or RNA helicase
VQPLANDGYDVFKNVFSIVRSHDPAANGQIKKLGSARAVELADINKRFLLRRATDDIMMSLLPPRTDHFVFVNMCAEQAVAYNSVIDLLRVESSKSATPSATALNLLQVMRRICNHQSLLNETGTSEGFIILLRRSACILNLIITTVAAHMSIRKLQALLAFITNEKAPKYYLSMRWKH